MAREGEAQSDTERTVEDKTNAQPRRAARTEAEHWHSRAQALLVESCKGKVEPQSSQKNEQGSPDMKHPAHSPDKAQPGDSLSTGRSWKHTGHK